MIKDWKTTLVATLCLLAFIACTVLLLLKKIDREDYAVSLSSMSAFALTLIGWFAKDSNKLK